MQLKFLYLLPFILILPSLHAQPPVYPKYYFRNPLSIPMVLAANFGELRPNHWHMGLDIRTRQKENFAVYAAAEGYITHVGIRPQSFGRYIIINHPNGLSTLYGHLNDFFPELEAYVREQQQNEESWNVELDMLRNRFPVVKGQLIAYSGNTGGSQGPHLHFEIRDTKSGKCLNPLLFGFPLKDDVPPTIVKLAMYNRGHSMFEKIPEFFALKKTDSGYILPKVPVIQTGYKKVSFAIQAFDRLSGSENSNGIYSAKLFLDERPVIGFVLDSIDYPSSQYLNAHIDYSYRYDGGPFVQHLSQLPGEHSGVYHPVENDGVIQLQDTFQHKVRIEVLDAQANMSALIFSIRYNDSIANSLPPDSNSFQRRYFYANQENVLKKTDFEIIIPETCLYDSVMSFYFRGNSHPGMAVSAEHRVNDASVPVHDDLTVRIKPDILIPERYKDKLIIQKSYRSGISVRKAKLEYDSAGISWLTAKFGDFGIFQAFVDTLAPEINELGMEDTVNLSAQNKIMFRPADNFGTIAEFSAALDGKWLCFTNDKSRYWIYAFDERCPYGVHHLKVSIKDLVGNSQTKEWWFKRFPLPPKKSPAKKKAKGKTSSKSVKSKPKKR